jgi:lipoyl(octanoyl) transferase
MVKDKQHVNQSRQCGMVDWLGTSLVYAQKGKHFQPLRVEKLGKVDYQMTLAYQEKLVALRRKGQIPDTLLLLEHPPVFTIGRNGGRHNILCSQEILIKEGIQIYEANRGGNVTYHGPGQLVGYPILDLSQRDKDVHCYVRELEKVLIQGLKDYLRPVGLTGHRISGYTGVWVGEEKIAAIGVGCKEWVTMHGFALNVNTNLRHFGLINPCGLGKPVTSLAKILKKEIDLGTVMDHIIPVFCEIFNFTAEEKISLHSVVKKF